MTGWFMAQMNAHFNYGQKVGLLRKMATADFIGGSLLEFGGFDLFDSLPEQALALPSNSLAILEYALYGLAVDYANVNYQSDNIQRCGTAGCLHIIPNHTSVSLCGSCVDSSDLGNMMFGLGGAARRYDLAFTYSSAASYNFLFDNTGIIGALTSPDGRGAIPGYLIGKTGAFLNQGLFCNIVNRSRIIGYNDMQVEHERCKACTVKVQPDVASPSSFDFVSKRPGTTIDQLTGKALDYLQGGGQ